MKTTSCKKLLLIGIFAISAGNMHAENTEHCKTLPTYFQYSPSEIKALSDKKSTEKMTNKDLVKWDEIARDLDHNNPGPDTTRVYAYLYTAQREAAFLSYNTHEDYTGSLGPISVKILQLFYSSVPTVKSDEYSESLANIVYAKLKARFDEEKPMIKESPVAEKDLNSKDFPKPLVGLCYATCKPWLLDNPKQYMAPKPPPQTDNFWMEQSKIVKEKSNNATEKQLQAVKYWAGMAGPESGNWMAIANDYMFSKDIPFSETVYVRSLLAEAGVDIDIAIFNSKYTYLIKRPGIVNPEVTQHIPFPKHPSYPSGHSTWSPACATILSFYFPENKAHWFELAEEAGYSRIWAGIHYPIDHENGWNFGIDLGNKILKSSKILPVTAFQEDACEVPTE